MNYPLPLVEPLLIAIRRVGERFMTGADPVANMPPPVGRELVGIDAGSFISTIPTRTD